MSAAGSSGTRRVKRLPLHAAWLAMLVAAVLVAVLAELKAQPASGEEGLVLAGDTALGDAMRAGDKSAARRLLSLQFTYTDEIGKLLERHEFLANLKGLAPAPATGVKAGVYGHLAIVTGHRKSAQGSNAFFLDIWAKQKGAWRALAMQDVALGETSPTSYAPDVPGVDAKVYDCKNPCQTIPYRVRSPAEQDVFNTFQVIERAAVARDAAEWGKHIADEFVHYRTGDAPVSKADRVALLEKQKAVDTPVVVPAVQSMRLWVYGDGAAMVSTGGVPEASEPLLHVTRVWVKRNGQWLMAISAQTAIKN